MRYSTSLLVFLLGFSVCVAQPGAGKIGIGLGGIGGFGMEFTDAARTMRSFDGAGTDASGDPTGDFQTIVFDMRPCCPWLGSVDDPDGFVPELMSGPYRLTFNGQATITSTGEEALIQNQIYDADLNVTTADLIVQRGFWLVNLSFTGTRRTAASATDTGISNISLQRPGYHNRPGDIFRQEFLNAVSLFPVVRFMDFVQTNNSNPVYPATTEWSDRMKPDQALFHGVSPWEYVVELANLTAKDIWINIPVAASDDYVINFAQLLKDQLHPDAAIYIEYSNEVWNSGFDQFAYNDASAQNEVSTELGGGATTALNDEAGQCDPADESLWRGRRFIRRTKEIADIFIDTFSPGTRDSFGEKIRPVFAWQIGGWIPYYSCILTWFEQEYGPADESFYGLAGAAYVNAGGAPDNALPDAILQQMVENSNNFRGSKRDTPANWLSGEGKIGLKEIADIFNLRMLQYETGPDNGGGSPVNVANRIRANRDSEMKDVLLTDLGDNWFSDPLIAGDLVMYFVLSSSYTRYGSWGATEEVENLHTPKLQALYSLAGIDEDTEPPGFPANVSVEVQGDDVHIAWEAATDNERITHYRVYDHRGAVATVLADEPLTVVLPLVDENRLSDISVVAVDAFNNISTDVVIGLEETVRSRDFQVVPNPATEKFEVRLSRIEPMIEVSLITVTGKVIRRQVGFNTDRMEFSRRDIPPGFYIVSMRTDRISTQKVIFR